MLLGNFFMPLSMLDGRSIVCNVDTSGVTMVNIGMSNNAITNENRATRGKSLVN